VGYTPGPWRVEGPYVFSSGRTVARFDWDIRDAADEANARLIAAAPDLLAAAETVLAGLNERIDTATDRTPVFAGIAALSDAIHKARGEA
jgi:hypothetical protein